MIYDKYKSDDFMRKTPIITDHVYHVFNRGVNRGDIFFAQGDYRNFLQGAVHYKNSNNKFSYIKRNPLVNHDPVSLQPPKVEILAYCLMPNHVHFLIKQLVDGGITSFMRRISNSHSHYLNIKHGRSGPVFESRFKVILVETDEQLMHLSRYIHLNPLVSNLTSDLDKYGWSSYSSYTTSARDFLCEPQQVLSYFKSKEEYKNFVSDQADYGRELEKIKHFTHDHETGS
ncbi:hypothetical protein A2870_03945 [Candidatus Curtissbacteria bacterium RIFCSPHIGHO2_01_FULL_41_11]|uniref:Transposase IS200-like domain-containing protein n=1 Tax=Candidatus Curtissbacteria bacterium RIFCSPHIGHO2_01_FULL_41_11 TaxID=1797711 RepID=A0A1F5G7T1_9BACT|nr:MAG: hypothetical protein A2870_03945 [Candidatus Curtissbacteria bacterium RIFCSPHIGHO2_01_FULL_41_11]